MTSPKKPAFNVSVYRSADGVSRDALVGSREVTFDQERTIGAHAVGVGVDLDDFREDYRLIAVVDPLNEVVEASEENNEIAFRGGAFLTPDGTLHVHGGDAAETVRIDRSAASGATGSPSAITVKINEWTLDYDTETLREIHLRLHGGDDVLKVQPQVTHSIHAYGGDGDDRILAGAGSDWLIGGMGNDFIAGRGNRDYIEGNDGDDTLLGGTDNDTLLGLVGNDKLASGPGRDIVDGGDGADIVDGGQDDDMVYSGRGADRIVNPPGANDARDAKSEDTLLTTTPEDLVFAELSAEDNRDPLESESLQSTSLMSASATETYGYAGFAGPFWLENDGFGNTIYQPEGEESSFWPFTIKREDIYGPDVVFDLSYSGTATAADFLYQQTSVTVLSGAWATGVEIQVYDDATLEGTEDFTAWFASAVVPSDPGMYIIVDYPSTGQPDTDPDGDPYSATNYIVDGNVTLYDENEVAMGEIVEENPGAFLQVGNLYRLDVATSHTTFGPNEFALWHSGSLAIWRDMGRTDQVYDGYAMPGTNFGYVTPGTYYVEALGPTSDALISLVRMQTSNAGHIDQVSVSAGLLEVTSTEGDIILVNDQDADFDGLADYVDGFDDFFGHVNDDLGTADYFMPLIISIDGDFGITDLTFSYSASDPRGITATLDNPYILPAGELRLWTVDGNQARSGASILAGGDYLPPGTYTLQQLGLVPAYDQTLTLYVEGIQESSVEGGATVSVEAHMASGSVTDEVDFTTVRFELLGRGYGDSGFQQQDVFVGSHLLEPNDPDWEAAGIMRGSYQSYKINVYDPRPGITHVSLGAYSLPLSNDGYKYTTGEFIFPESGSDIPGGLLLLSAPSDEVQWQFNPGGRRRIVHPEQLNDWDADLAAEIIKTIEGMEGTWPTQPVDDGAFGREVHARVSSTFRDQDGWLVDVWVSNSDFRTIVDPGTANSTQVDFLKVEPGYSVETDDILDTTKVHDLYDIKTGLNGTMTADQRDRLKKVLNGGTIGTRQIKVAMAPQRWTNSGGWKANKNYGNGFRLLSLIGFGAAGYATAHAMFTFDEFDPDFIALVDEAKRIQKMNDPQNKRIFTAAWLETHVKPFLSKFSPDSAPIDFGVKAVQYQIIGQIQ
jgi:Ca2+-binding RTX toxin-like protein